MADPFREHRLPPGDVRRVLRRALDLAEADPKTAASERALTRSELEQLGAELGLPEDSVARALRDGEAPASATARPSWFLGAPTRILFEEEVEGEPTDADREDMLEEIRDVLGETGSVETVGKTMIWKLAPVQGRVRELTVRIRARDGRTRIVVEERLVRQAVGLFVGLGVGGGIGPMGGYVVATMFFGVIGLLLPLIWIPSMLLLARTIFGALVARRQRALRDLTRRLVESAAGWSRPKTTERKMRVVSPPAADVDAEAEEEATAADAEGAPVHVSRK